MQLSNNHKKLLPGTSLFHPEASMKSAKSSKKELAPMTPRIDYPAPRILRMDAGDGGTTGAVALAMSAEKTRKKKGFNMRIFLRGYLSVVT